MLKPFPEEKIVELSQFIYRGEKIQAIKLYRELTGLGLKEAKDEVETLETSLRQSTPEKFTAPPRGKGCLGVVAMVCLGGALLLYWLVRK